MKRMYKNETGMMVINPIEEIKVIYKEVIGYEMNEETFTLIMKDESTATFHNDEWSFCNIGAC